MKMNDHVTNGEGHRYQGSMSNVGASYTPTFIIEPEYIVLENYIPVAKVGEQEELVN